MITVTVEVSEGFTNRRVRCTAPSIERAIELARGPSDTTAKVLFPIDPDTFFADDAGTGISDETTRLESRPAAGVRS